MNKKALKLFSILTVLSFVNSIILAEEPIQLAEALPISPRQATATNSAVRPRRTMGSLAAPERKSTKQSATLAQIVSVKKKVEIQSKGKPSWSPANTKSVVRAEDKLRTGSRSIARVKMQDGTTVLLLQNSEAEVENLSSVRRTIKLLRGKVRAIVKSLQGPGAFQIKTPIGVASVRGTEFVVEYQEEAKNMSVDVLQGEVGVSKLGDLANEVIVTPGEKVQFGAEGEIGSPQRSGALPMEAQDVQIEAYNDQVKQNVIAMAAEEERNADFQVGKSLIDVDGNRVRVEEYIMRPAANQFKLVALNERENHFDYFTYKGTFDRTLPDDLSVALKQVGGTLNNAPDYHLTDYEMMMSNTIDHIDDTGTGGHVVKVEVSPSDSTKYRLTDMSTSETRDIDMAELQSNGTYTVYDPVHDKFTRGVSSAELNDVKTVSVLDPDSNSYRNFGSADTLYKTRFNTSSYSINNVLKMAYAAKSSVTNTLAIDLDTDFSNQPTVVQVEQPAGANSLHNRLSLYYQDGSHTTIDTYIIDDEGKIGTKDAFSGATTSESYQNELVKWNYQQKIKSDEMTDEINLVIDPRIGTMSGLIQ